MALPNYIRQETNLTGEIVNANVAAAGLEIQVAFVDKKTGEARTPQDTTLQFVINKDNSKFEIIRAESHVTADGVTTITVKADGRKIPSFGSGSGAGIGNSHNIGDSVSCVYTADQVNNIIEVLEGNFATGASELKLGTEANGDITITFENGEANKPFLKWDQAQSKLLFSNNGVDVLAIGTGGGDIQSGGGTTVDGGVLNINLGDETTFTTDGGAGNEGLAVVTDENGLIDPSLLPYEFVTSSAGADDSGKGVLLDAAGQLDSSFINMPAIDTGKYVNRFRFGVGTNLEIPEPAAVTARIDAGLPVPAFEILEQSCTLKAGITDSLNDGAYSENNLVQMNTLGVGTKYYLKINTGGSFTATWGYSQLYTTGTVTYTIKIVGSDANGLPDLNNVKFSRIVVNSREVIGSFSATIEDGDFYEFTLDNVNDASEFFRHSITVEEGQGFVGNDVNNLGNLPAGTQIPYPYIYASGSGASTGTPGICFGRTTQLMNDEFTTQRQGLGVDYLGMIVGRNQDGSYKIDTSKYVFAGYTERGVVFADGNGAFSSVGAFDAFDIPDRISVYNNLGIGIADGTGYIYITNPVVAQIIPITQAVVGGIYIDNIYRSVSLPGVPRNNSGQVRFFNSDNFQNNNEAQSLDDIYGTGGSNNTTDSYSYATPYLNLPLIKEQEFPSSGGAFPRNVFIIY